MTMTCNVILASIPGIKERNKEIKVREKNRERQKTRSSFVSFDIKSTTTIDAIASSLAKETRDILAVDSSRTYSNEGS